MERCDVLIVGGGPAGSSCAWKLKEAGLKILLLDKSAFPRNKTCAGWVTPPVIQTLDLDLDHYKRQHTLQPITGFRTGLIGGKEVETFYPGVVSYGIRRCEFDHYLLKRSKVRCHLSEAVKSIQREKEQWIINEKFTAPMLVAAGGHFCPVARFFGRRSKATASIVTAQEIEFEASPTQLKSVHVDPEIPELFFLPDLTGYGWCFRKNSYLNIGLGRVDGAKLSSHVADFCEFLNQRKKICCKIPAPFHGHAYQLYERTQPLLLDDGVLLVGDAAGLAYPQSGEGIRPAVESGQLAAAAILAANGDYCRGRLDTYRTSVTSRFGPPRTGAPAGYLPAAWLQFLAARLLSTHWFAKRVVLDRWFLHADTTPL